MTVTDSIADLFTRIRNANDAGHPMVVSPFSKQHEWITKLLIEEGYLQGCQVREEGKKKRLEIYLKYFRGKKVIQKIQRVSRPGRRYYLHKRNISKVLGGYGISILSTNQGIMTGQQARTKNVGGELIGIVW